MKKSEVLTLLQAIQYPGFSRDIVSFGMVKNVVVSKNTVEIELTIKTQNDEKKQIVVDEIKNTPIYRSKAIEVEDYFDLGTWTQIYKYIDLFIK